MSYEVTATRKRPQIFEQLAGQEFVSATLEKSIETGRIAHAYLFSGPRGCGKTSTARILAKALNCEKGPTAHPCGECDSCKAIAAGSSLDVIEIDGASNTSVENVRQIKDEVLFPPNSGRYKVYIIDEVHMLSTSAFNALLKTIEEPPPYVVFIFATTEPHKVPATIKSRCQQFTFRLVPSDVVVKLLASAAQDIGVSAEAEALLWIARESGGSVRDAYTLFDQIVSFAEGHITAKLIKEKLGLVGQDQMNLLFGAFVRGDTSGALSLLDEILSGGVSNEQFVVDAVEYCRALLLLKNGITKESLIGAPVSSFDLSIGEALSVERIEQLLSIFLSAYRTLKESIDPRYELELAVAKGSHIGEFIAPGDLANAVAVLRRQLLGQSQGQSKIQSQGQGGDTASGVAFGTGKAGGVNDGRLSGVSTGQRGNPAPAEQRQTQPQPLRSVVENKATVAGLGVSASSGSRPSASQSRDVGSNVGMVNANSGSSSTANQSASNLGTTNSSTTNSSVAPQLSLQNLGELKRVLVADVRKNNVMLATTIEKSHDWEVVDSVLWLTVNTKMEFDLMRRFLGLIAEIVAQKLGSAQRLDVRLASSTSAGGQSSRGTGNSRGAGSGYNAGNGSSNGTVGLVDSVRVSAGLASGHGVGQGVMAGSRDVEPKGGAQGAEESAVGGEVGALGAETGVLGAEGGPRGNEAGSRFGRKGFLDEGAGFLAKEGASETATRPAAAAMSPEEAAVVAAVEKCFKGSLVAVSDAATAGDSASSIVQGGSTQVRGQSSSAQTQSGPTHTGLSESSEPNASVSSSDERTKVPESEASEKDDDEDSFYSDPFYDEPF